MKRTRQYAFTIRVATKDSVCTYTVSAATLTEARLAGLKIAAIPGVIAVTVKAVLH
jgi:hypothetical protein